MGTLHLEGTLKLHGNLMLGNKVLIEGKEALVALAPSADPHSKKGLPTDKSLPEPRNAWIWAKASRISNVTVDGKAIVVNGAPCTRGVSPVIEGTVTQVTGTVTVEGLAIAVKQGTAMVADTPVVWENSGQ